MRALSELTFHVAYCARLWMMSDGGQPDRREGQYPQQHHVVCRCRNDQAGDGRTGPSAAKRTCRDDPTSSADQAAAGTIKRGMVGQSRHREAATVPRHSQHPQRPLARTLCTPERRQYLRDGSSFEGPTARRWPSWPFPLLVQGITTSREPSVAQ
jgi:hypothetical protein